MDIIFGAFILLIVFLYFRYFNFTFKELRSKKDLKDDSHVLSEKTRDFVDALDTWNLRIGMVLFGIYGIYLILKDFF